LGGKCIKCGENRPHILAFHHIVSTEKNENPSRFLANSQIEKFFEEIKKCILLCSNCHGDFHYLNNNYNITIEEYLGKNIEPLIIDVKQQEKSIQQNKKEEILKWQLELLKKEQKKRHIYKGKIIAFNEKWLQEFETVEECAIYMTKILNLTIDNCRDGIRRVINGKRLSYHNYRFTKNN